MMMPGMITCTELCCWHKLVVAGMSLCYWPKHFGHTFLSTLKISWLAALRMWPTGRRGLVYICWLFFCASWIQISGEWRHTLRILPESCELSYIPTCILERKDLLFCCHICLLSSIKKKVAFSCHICLLAPWKEGSFPLSYMPTCILERKDHFQLWYMPTCICKRKNHCLLSYIPTCIDDQIFWDMVCLFNHTLILAEFETNIFGVCFGSIWFRQPHAKLGQWLPLLQQSSGHCLMVNWYLLCFHSIIDMDGSLGVLDHTQNWGWPSFTCLAWTHATSYQLFAIVIGHF